MEVHGRAIVIVKPEYFGGASPCANHSARSPSDRLVFQHLSQPPPANELYTCRPTIIYNTDGVVRSCGSFRFRMTLRAKRELMSLNITTKRALFCRC